MDELEDEVDETSDDVVDEGGEGGAGAGGAGGDGGGEKAVPYARFAKVNAARKEAVARAKQFEADAKEVPGLRTQLEQLQTTYTTDKESWEQRFALVEAGLSDTEGQEVARMLYGRLPAEGKPASIGEWVTGLKAEGATVPKALGGYLTGATSKAPPPTPGSGGNQPPAANNLTPDQIRTIREKAVKTGDWTEWNRVKGSLGIK